MDSLEKMKYFKKLKKNNIHSMKDLISYMY